MAMRLEEEMEKREAQMDESRYIGNIWGWKFSWISLGIIVFFLSLMLVRYFYLQQTGQWPEPTTTIEMDVSE